VKAAKKARHRGRPAGPETVAVPLRLFPDQKRDLLVLKEILDGRPPLNGLIQDAVTRYIEAKLSEPKVRAAYEERSQPRLRVVGPRSGGLKTP